MTGASLLFSPFLLSLITLILIGIMLATYERNSTFMISEGKGSTLIHGSRLINKSTSSTAGCRGPSHSIRNLFIAIFPSLNKLPLPAESTFMVATARRRRVSLISASNSFPSYPSLSWGHIMIIMVRKEKMTIGQLDFLLIYGVRRYEVSSA